MPRLRPMIFLYFLFSILAPSFVVAQMDDQTLVIDPSYWTRHFSVHGYATIGYGELNPDTQGQRSGDEEVLGLSEGGGFHGVAALNIQYQPLQKHRFVLQLSSAELGDSPADGLNDNVELDWFFYEYSPLDHTRLRVGRFPAPVGIENEVRDVGVLLPFFRPSFVFYREGSIFSETVDGLSVSHTFLADKSWNLETAAYFGTFEVLEQTVELRGNEPQIVDISNALGFQVWLNSPFDHLRFGVGGLRWDIGAESVLRGTGQEEEAETWYLSIDGAFQRFSLKAEYRHVDQVLQLRPQSPRGEAELRFYYWQLGWRSTDRLSFYLQPEYAEVKQSSTLFPGSSTSSTDRFDLGFSAVYEFRPSLVLKAEVHRVEAEKPLGTELVTTAGGGTFPQIVFEDRESDYGLISLSFSF